MKLYSGPRVAGQSRRTACGLQRWLFVLMWVATICMMACAEPPLEQICNDDPGNSQCIPGDAGAPGTSAGCETDAGFCLTFYEFAQNDETYILGQAGQFATRIGWQLVDGAPAAGAVVQKVTLDGTGLYPADGAACSQPSSLDTHYWELFPVSADSVTTQDEWDEWDEWGNPNHHADGTLQIVGEASYYTNAEMGAALQGFVEQGKAGSHRLAGVLRSRTTEPAFWNMIPKPRLRRTVELSWEHCPDGATQLVCGYMRGAELCQ